ncbi:polysaccharide biosynthesis/export family protein [Chitinophaga tropicalis]|uniref:Polysaccharide export outer membrane protein n=1 Tax=Chitinophaga tropicalis TaxID=2683588 RepID=A0A7K1U4H8_9BACT|nr:polysaccharide biosynthesis/export family protein [Chitinophaga tropicalis]MVT08895.1 hypothetical protein [Chitinophaga tropicalis]
MRLNSIFILLILSGFTIYFGSCASPKNIAYFKDVPDTAKLRLIEQAAYNTPKIQPDDILQVTIQTLDPGSSGLFDQAGGGNTSPGTANGMGNLSGNGYLVDKEGYVILPLLGKVSVLGKTTDQVRDEISAKAAVYYKDPVVNVRFSNFKITVLGEVVRPSSYVMPNEKVTILDALGMAGDLTIYGRRENVLLIRANGNKKEFVRFNLNDSKIFSSPYFYLHQGDVVYVEPNKSKVASTDMAKARNFTIIASILSVIVILATRISF